MAPSFVSRPLACVIAVAVAVGIAAQSNRTDEPIEFASQSMTFDGARNLFELESPEITQGDLRIVASQALATDIEFNTGSEWRFTGKIRLVVGTAVIEAERAVFTFENRRLARGELEGGPVAFSDIDQAADRNVTGSAQKMSYDYIARTLRMTGNPASVRKNRIEMQGCDLIYDFTAERMTSGSADCADQFRMRTLPDPAESAAAPAAPQ
jgi:lipopolysaccharide transport protein LptA